MARNPAFSSEKYPATSLAALREFNDRYLAALMSSAPSGWHTQFGETITTSAPLLTFPLSQFSSRFQRFDGEDHFENMLSKSFDLKAERWTTGYQAKWYDLTKNFYEYKRWKERPAEIVVEEQNFVAEKFAALLEAGESTAFLDTGSNFFDTDIPANLFDASKGTISNYNSSTTNVVSVSNLATEVKAMQLVLDSGGRKLNLRADTILVPIEKEEELNIYLAKENLAIAASTATSNTSETNVYKGRFKVIGCREFTDVNDWYLVASGAVNQYLPLIAMKETVDSALNMKTWDQNSDFFKKTEQIAVAIGINYGFGLGFPHAIRKIKGA